MHTFSIDQVHGEFQTQMKIIYSEKEKGITDLFHCSPSSKQGFKYIV